MLEDFVDSLRNFARNKTRTILSLLGVIIGVASVILITSMGQSSTRQIEDTFGSSGLDLVQVSSGFMRRRREAVSLKFDETFRQELFDNVRNIRRIWYKNSLSATLSFGDTSVTASCTAIEPGYLEMYGLDLDYGNYFTVTDDVYGAQKVILGSEVATSLFPDGNAVGRGILLVTSNVPFSFSVVGVLKEQTSGMENSTSGIYIPHGFYAKKIAPNPDASVVMVQAESTAFCTQIVNDITAWAEQKTGTEGSINAMSMQTIIEQMRTITQTLSLMLSGIAAISLLVGGIGIMNIMIVTVTERRQEIGIRKALGASPAAIRRQFLVESASITLLGGSLGIVLGIALSFAVEYVRDQPFAIQASACVVSFVFSVFVGVFFGLNPASRAAKLDPVEALAG
ncbi:MAG: ABC transporter permease [Treponemataceae bacterium]|nr:ABC transporter permease [Treponemataceae bacterium]